MFSLILTIIAVVLVTVLALATFYFGGSAFSQGKDAAAAARVINDATQIQAAVTLYSARFGSAPKGTQEQVRDALVNNNYLASFPTSAEWVFVDDYVTVPNLSDAQCLAVNLKLGIENIPQCSEVDTLGRPACCKG